MGGRGDVIVAVGNSEGALTCVFGLRPIDETLDVRGLAGLVLSSAITFAAAQQR